MKHIRLFEDFGSSNLTEEQLDWLDSVVSGIWDVDDKGEISVHGHVRCTGDSKLKKIPVQFKHVTGDFFIKNCSNLQSLKGCPQIVEGSFSCSACTSLLTLEGGPRQVDGYFECYLCTSLVSLKGAPLKVRCYFDCGHCDSLVSLEGSPEKVKYDFWCRNCRSLTTVRGVTLLDSNGDYYFDECPRIPQEELDLLERDKDIFLQWIQSDMKIGDFLHQKRGMIKGKEFGF